MIDFMESIVTVGNDDLMLIEFIEANSDLTPYQVLECVQHLFTKGKWDAPGGNGDVTAVTLKRVHMMSDRRE